MYVVSPLDLNVISSLFMRKTCTKLHFRIIVKFMIGSLEIGQYNGHKEVHIKKCTGILRKTCRMF